MGWYEVTIVVLVLAIGALGLLVLRDRKARRRLRLLARVAELEDEAKTLEETFGAICDVVVPALADFAVIDVFERDAVTRVAVRVGPGAPPSAEAGLLRRQPVIGSELAIAESGRPSSWFMERISGIDLERYAADPGDREFLEGLGIRSLIRVALRARGRVKGTLTLGTAGWSRRRFDREDAEFIASLASRVGLVLDNAGLFADLERAESARAEIAETLQRGLLPPPLPDIPGWTIAATYRPSGAENEVGGDFYDAFRLASGGWMLVVGDVTGRGARAASITAVARYTLRTAAALTADPLEALTALNKAMLARGEAALCSLVALIVREDAWRPIRVAVAGHPPPLIVDGDEITEIEGRGPVLGAFADATWGVATSSIEPGQVLVIVTDGIVEAQGGERRFGEDGLRAALRGLAGPGEAAAGVERAVDDFCGGRLHDDVAILALSRSATGEALPLAGGISDELAGGAR